MKILSLEMTLLPAYLTLHECLLAFHSFIAEVASYRFKMESRFYLPRVQCGPLASSVNVS